jgi:hypothetical protein
LRFIQLANDENRKRFKQQKEHFVSLVAQVLCSNQLVKEEQQVKRLAEKLVITVLYLFFIGKDRILKYS